MAEAATRVTPDSWSDEVVVFGRYEKFDTQNKMPAGYLPLQEFQRSAWVAGATYYPDPDVAFKFDFVRERNKSGVVRAPVANQFRCGLVVLMMTHVACRLIVGLALASPKRAKVRKPPSPASHSRVRGALRLHAV